MNTHESADNNFIYSPYSHNKTISDEQQDIDKTNFLYCLKNYLMILYKKSEIFFHLLVGLPSYEKYLDYHKKYHPNCTPKSRKEFFLDSQNKRYSRDGAKKCC
ncbi:DUF466 domain-containing protein [Helicobacter didelphidarum]|uniref:DUF466 domain-containing protein n=1 Tax=Helicobacter didelphidarum TaxID=2040648 RepID=A0A3D8IQU9_9HELI|nr:DUF466 domain-containing protein [Helicobacter didelphidarum]